MTAAARRSMVPGRAGPSKPRLLSRRSFIANAVKFAVAGAVVPGAASQLIPTLAPDSLAGGLPAPLITRDRTTRQKIPVTLADFAGDPPVVVNAELAFLPAFACKVKKATLEASSRARGYNTGQHAIEHPTEPDNAILVYDGKCKHLGCPVGWDGNLGGSKDIRDYDGDGVNDGRILCPCHQGQYDIYNLARNQPATPPPAPLNVIRIRIGDAEIDGVTKRDILIGQAKLVQGGYRDADLEGDGAPFRIASQAPTEAA